jgi:hypothetical protein
MRLHKSPGDYAVATVVRTEHEPPGAVGSLLAFIVVEELHDDTLLRFDWPTIQVHAHGNTLDDPESHSELVLLIFGP